MVIKSGRDGETEGQRDRETERQRESVSKFPSVSPSPRLPISLSLCLSVSLSLCLSVSLSTSSTQAQPAIKDSAARVTEALAGASHLVAEILAIEDPAARAEALRKFVETNNISEQIQAAREAVVTRRAQLAESALSRNDLERGMENFRRAVAVAPERGADRF